MVTGCWQYRELNDLAIISAIGIDKEEDEYLVSVQIINVKKQTKDFSGGDESPVTVYEGRGKTLGEALNTIELESPKELYLGHIDMVVIGEETARIGLREYIDFLLRDREVRKIYPFVIAKGAKAIDLLNVLTPIETLPSANLVSIISTSEKTNGTITNRTFDNVLMCLYVRGRHPGITAIEIIGPEEEGEETDNISSTTPKTRLLATGPAIMKDDKLLGYLTDDQGLGYNIIRDRVISSIISFPCDDEGNYGAVKIDKPKVNLKTSVKEDEPFTDLKVDVTATLTDYNCKADLQKSKSIDKIEKWVNDEIKSILEDIIEATQKDYKSDILGFGEKLYHDHYKYWEKVEKDWDEMYSELKYKVEVKTKINNTGSITIPAKEGGKGGDN
jgi:spore germination protein KC